MQRKETVMFSSKNLLGVWTTSVALVTPLGICAAKAVAAPVTLHVAVNGSYSRTRLEAADPAKPVGTIDRAVVLSQPGDTIEVAPGTYFGTVNITNASNLIIHGKPGAEKPVLQTPSGKDYSVVRISGSNYVTFSGFDINGTGGGKDCNGITIVPRTNSDTGAITTSHHIAIRYNLVHDAGGAGICTNPDSTYTVGCDYIQITGNEIYNTNTTSKYRGSAISLHQDQNWDNAAGYHSIIQTNNIHDNVNQNRDLDANGNVDPFLHTDGNGIIIDTTKTNGPRVLIQNNLVYRNGGRGIHVFDSSNVDVLNNTLYGNDLDPYLTGGGELTAVTAGNVLFSNNVVQGNGKAPAFVVGKAHGTTNGLIQFKNNTYTGAGSAPPASTNPSGYADTQNAIDWSTTFYSEPSWGSLFVNSAAGDFHLRTLATRSGLTSQASQTALNRGSSLPGEFASYDIAGVARKPVTGNPPGGAIDRGAYEQ